MRVVPLVPTEAWVPIWPAPGPGWTVTAECWHSRPLHTALIPALGCANAPPTHKQHRAVSPSDVHTSASRHVLEAGKVWDYVNLAQLELRSRDSLSCMLPGAGWPQEKCAQGRRSRNTAQAIPRRRSLRGARQCCSSHTRPPVRSHLAGVGKHLA